MIYSYPIPERFADKELDAGQVQTFLVSKGIVVSSVSITRENIEVDANVDPKTVLQTYEVQPPRSKQIKQQLATLDLTNATNAQLRQAVILLVELVQLRID